MKNKKTLIKAVKSLILILAMAVCVIGIKPLVCEAYTPKSLNKEIKKVTKQLKTLEKKDKLQSKGCVSFWGTIINRDPLIIKKIGLTPTYYWINNPKNVNILLTNVTGHAIDTGKTKVFEAGGLKYTCKVVNAKKTNSKLTSKIVSLRNKLTKLKNTKKNRWFLTYDSINLVKRAKYNATYNGFWLYKEAYPQKLSFSSSKKSVAAVNKRTGLITAKKLGSATITMKAKASGKKVKLRINVVPPSIRFKQATYEFGADAYKKTGYLDFNYCSISRDINISIGDTSIISSAEKTAEGIRCTYTGKVGQTTITLKIKEGMSATCTVIVKESKNEDSENAKNSVTAEDPTTHTHQMKMESDDDYHWEQCVVCGEIQGKEEHTWNWDEEESYEATEDEEGLAVYYCKKCGIKRVSELPRKEHKCYDHLKVVPAKEATCTEEGNVRYYKCTLCNTLYKDSYPLEEIEDLSEVTVSKKGHNFSDKWNSDDNYHWKTCLVCGAIDDLTKQLHIWNDGEIVLMPTETEKGRIKYTCIGCGKTQEKEIKALGHKCANHLTKVNEKDATCNKEGNVLYYTCECGKWYYDQEAQKEITNQNDVIKAKTAHSYGEEWVKDANYHWKICSVCGEEDKQDHTWDAGEVITEPTETETGLMKHTCTACGETKEEEIKALGHICAHHLTKVEEKAPTCEKEGNDLYYTCECGKWYYDQEAKEEITDHNDVIKAKIAHSYGKEWIKNEAYHWRACSACGKINDLTKQEHTWDAGEVIVEPTETETGLMKYTCTACGESQEKEIKAFGHICAKHLTKVEEKKSTCKEEGNIFYYTCECGKWYYDQEAKEEITNHNDVIKAKIAHSYGEEWIKNEAYHWRAACSVCGKQHALIEHAWDTGKNEEYHWKICTVCGMEQKRRKHTWNDGEVIEEPTETETGLMKYTCTTCGETQEKEIEVLHICAHHLTEVKEKEPTCEKNGNILYYACSCGKWYYDQEAKKEVADHRDVAKAKIAHSYSEEWVRNEVYHWRVCSVCGEEDKQEHIWNAGEVITEPTETETGLMKYMCTICGETQEKEIKVLGHICANHLTKVNGKDATCNKEGNVLYYTCECGKWYYDQEAKEEITNHNDVIKAKTAHSYGEEWVKDEEYHWRACSVCGEIDALTKQEHTWDAGEVITKPTETETGLMKYTCTTCEETKEKEIEVLHICAHHLTEVEEKKPTCEKDGNILYYACSCGKWYYDQEAKKEITNHDEVVVYAGLYKEENDKRELIYTWKELLDKKIVLIKETNTIYRFQSNVKKAHLVIPEGITRIGDKAFSSCSNLTSISLPKGITRIGNNAFYDCESLTSINIPEGVMNIGVFAFYGCKSLKSISIPEGITSIEDKAFYNCESLTSISIPEGVTSIAEYAFYNCKSLTSISVPKGVTSIGEYAFRYCESLTSISLPEGITKIENNAFAGCSNLISISLPEGITRIGNYAFFYCESLTSISIPKGVTSIGNNAFYNCKSLTSISIPEGVTSIGDSVFSACSKLTKIEWKGKIYTSVDSFLSAFSQSNG